MRLAPLQKPPLGSQVNWGHPLARGLVGCWLMNEGSGVWVQDYSGNGNHGTCINMSPQSNTSGWNPGPHGGALVFDGSNDYINCGSGSSLNFGTNDFSVFAWINPKTYAASRYLFGRGNANDGWWSQLVWTTKLIFRIKLLDTATTNSAYVDGLIDIGDSNWHFVGFTARRSGNLSLFVDGKLDGTPASITTISNVDIAGPVYFGCRDATTSYLNAASNYMIYNRALSAEEIAFLYAFPYCMFEDAGFPAWMYSPSGQLLIHPGMNGGLNWPQLRGGLNG